MHWPVPSAGAETLAQLPAAREGGDGGFIRSYERIHSPAGTI